MGVYMEPIRDREKVMKILRTLKKNDQRRYMIFKIGFNTALRISDILRLKVDDVLDKNGTVCNYMTIKEKKTKKVRQIPIQGIRGEIARHIDLLRLERNHYLVPSYRSKSRPIHYMTIYNTFKKIEIGLGIHFGTHSMRKTWAYHAYNGNGKNIAPIMIALNHRDAATTLRYIGITQDNMQKIYYNNKF